MMKIQFNNTIKEFSQNILNLSEHLELLSKERETDDEPMPMTGTNPRIFEIFTEWFMMLNEISISKYDFNFAYVVFKPEMFEKFDNELNIEIFNFAIANGITLLAETLAFVLKDKTDIFVINNMNKKPFIEYSAEFTNFKNKLLYSPTDILTFNFSDKNNTCVIGEYGKPIIGLNEIFVIGVAGSDNEDNINDKNKLILPSTVKQIKREAIELLKNFETINLPNSITKIEKFSFENFTNLKHITLSNSINKIPTSAFRKCVNLEEIKIPESINLIAEKAFYECSRLTSIDLPNTITRIAEEAFENCIALKKLNKNNTLENLKVIGEDAFSGCSNLSDVNIPNVIELGERAFHNCLNLNHVSLSPELKRIKRATFVNCIGIDNITLPKNLEYIDDYAFAECHHLNIMPELQDNFEVLENLKSIGYYAFVGCRFDYIKIPNSVRNISSYAFMRCANLTKITLSNKLKRIKQHIFNECDKLETLEIPDSVEIISSYAFSGNSKLKEIILPIGLKEIEKGAFKDCVSLEIITQHTSKTLQQNYNKLPRIKYIGEETFRNCKSLETLEIPDSVTNIDKYAFYGCDNLTLRVYYENMVENLGIPFEVIE